MILSHPELQRSLREKLQKMTGSTPLLSAEKLLIENNLWLLLRKKIIEDNGYFESENL